jgi:hypothetical protein
VIRPWKGWELAALTDVTIPEYSKPGRRATIMKNSHTNAASSSHALKFISRNP